MSELYPLKFKPIFKEKIWGGNKIHTVLRQNYAPLPNCGEVWLISGLEEEPNVVENGFLKGNPLNELLEVYMGDLVGDKIYEKFGNEFPLLFKFINSEDYLSVQVHPGDELAMKRHQSLGKTEMWYVLAADENAKIISGFKDGVTKQGYLEYLKSNSLKEILNYEDVKTGDVFFVPSGHIHAIGPGILLAEIQQSSDITYRIYDWDRFDMAGLKRELHTELALDAINFEKKVQCKTHPVIFKNRPVNIMASDYFTVNLLELDENIERDFYETDSVVVYLCTDGAFTVVFSGEKFHASCGEAMLIPALIKEFELVPDNKCTLLETFAK